MKRVFLLIFLFGLLFVPSVYALTTTMRPTYAQGETMLIEIKGSILGPIQSSDVEFLRGHVQVGAFEYDLKRIGNRYFLYAIAPFTSNNYTLIIHGVETFVNGQAVTQDIEENFTITNETAPYTLRPGFVITDQDILLSLTRNRDTPETLSLPGNDSVQLQPGSNAITLSIEQFEPGFHMLMIGSYEFPLYNVRSPPIPPAPKTIEVSPLRIEERFIRDQEPRILTFIISNTADTSLEDFVFEYDPDRYTLAPSRLDLLEANKSATFNLTLLTQENDISDTFRIRVDGQTTELPLEITFIEENATVTNITTRFNSTLPPAPDNQYRCAELNGRICLATQQCSGETVTTIEGNCCRGTCVTLETKKSLAWLGYLIGIVVAFIILIIAGRYFKTRSKYKRENPLTAEMKKLEKPF